MTGVAHILVTALLWVVVPTSLTLWFVVFRRLSLGETLIPREERKEVPWQVIDVLGVAFVVGFCVLVTASQVADAYGMVLDSPDNWSAEQHLAIVIGSSCAILAGTLIGLFVIWIRVRASLRDFGFSTCRLVYDISLGLMWFAMLIVPVTLTQIGLTSLFPKADKHPFIEIILDDPNPRYVILVAVAAILMAPFCEEILFRVILQGWLEKLQRYWHDSFVMQQDMATPTPIDESDASETLASQTSAADGLEYAANETTENTTFWLPILISSFAFSAAHIGQGPAPISLFFLALGLGYLYQKTHRIWPCLIVHALVNSLAVLQLLLLIEQIRAAQ